MSPAAARAVGPARPIGALRLAGLSVSCRSSAWKGGPLNPPRVYDQNDRRPCRGRSLDAPAAPSATGTRGAGTCRARSLGFSAPRRDAWAFWVGRCLSWLSLLTQNGHPWGWPFHKEVRRCPTLPRGHPRSTIGAEGLSFRVRNVTGRFPFAMAAETLLIFQSEDHQPQLVIDRFSTVNREPQSGREHHSCGVKLSAY